MAHNPLKVDPSRTAMIRRQYVADMVRRFERVRRNVWAYIVKGDPGPLTANARYHFKTDAEKVPAFKRWLKKQIDNGILEISPATGEPTNGKPWSSKYINSAYRKGMVRAYTDTRRAELGKPAEFVEGSKGQFLQQAFAAPERTSKLKLLYTRSFEDLNGVTATMASQLNRALADGIAKGEHPIQTARTMSKTIKKLTRTRATAIALTEVIHAHAEGALDGLEDLNIVNVTADVEFSTAGDNIVCPKCKALNGKIYTIQKARGVIPVHPRCRCAWLPVVNVPKRKKN